jgi:hypothetical protein
MDGEDAHCIKRQLSAMLWDDAVFRMVNECRRLAPKGADGEPALNPTIHGRINLWYFATQALAIRRLTEPNWKQEKQYVVSLRRLLDDIKAHVALLTRGNFFEAEGLPYNYETVRDEYYRQQTAAVTGRQQPTRRRLSPDDWLWAERLHEHFDCLSRADSAHRSKTDQVDPEVFDVLRLQLAPCERLKPLVDKLVAHAADPGNRDRIPEQDRQISLAKIWECHAALCKVTSFVSVVMLRRTDFPGLATPLFDQFQHMDQPWVDTGNLEALDESWRLHEREVRSWASVDWPPVWPSARGDEAV